MKLQKNYFELRKGKRLVPRKLAEQINVSRQRLPNGSLTNLPEIENH